MYLYVVTHDAFANLLYKVTSTNLFVLDAVIYGLENGAYAGSAATVDYGGK